MLILVITTPLVLFLGPYKNTRKVFVATLLATRHAYLLTDYFTQDELNDLMGLEKSDVDIDAMVKEPEKEVNVKVKTGNEITPYKVETDRYTAYILEIKNPFTVKAAMTKYIGKIGQRTSEMAEEHGAEAAINGGSFSDDSSDGTKYAGTGGRPEGFVVSNGKLIYPVSGYNENTIENSVIAICNGKLVVGQHSLAELKKMGVQEAMCFRIPNIIIDGRPQVRDTMLEGLNPRTAIGQKSDGTIIFLVIDGRKITMPGASLYDVQQIMLERGAVNAATLDGGYSTTMYYNGEVINSPNAWDGERTVATAFYVE